ncbi:hydrogenase expression/formation protein HypE [Synechococcus sp. CS-1328]|uniref:hydrogenase expression/formation protein HypE n=1 Tax=Synechococcus sp. CS-1328 TaxID=2847976 RepID=UPI00223AA664|nr:hydrogenase expression/formation protein HypE [Synechococcus sp. CS-1328]MCT0225061.1 hydrogenase expression/formation protein HypE [Synechococcus sp. CS-1328]
MEQNARIRLAHGGGGTLMQQLIDQELRRLYADPQQLLHDAASLTLPPGQLAFTTDSYVVQPLEFPGGDIGSLAITGTANDLAMAGARPLHLSVALILEEGLPLSLLRRVVGSMVTASRACGLTIVTGDTKVVERGKADGLFINTSGIGVVEASQPIHPSRIAAGDQLLVSGDLGRHGVAILAARHGLQLDPPVLSDCAPLWPLVQQLLQRGARIHCLRDLTRGGLASALQELALAAGLTLQIEEERIPVIEPVARCCDLLGFEPLHLANEGRFLAVVPAESLDRVAPLLEAWGGSWIGSVLPEMGEAPVLLRTAYGSSRVLRPLSGELLPRIC